QPFAVLLPELPLARRVPLAQPANQSLPAVLSLRHEGLPAHSQWATCKRSLFLLNLHPNRGDVGPELFPGRPFLLGQDGQGLLVAQSSQVWILLPVTETLLDDLTSVLIAFVGEAGVDNQVGPQPVEGLLAEAATLLLIPFAGILSFSADGQGSGAGSVVAE